MVVAMLGVTSRFSDISRVVASATDSLGIADGPPDCFAPSGLAMTRGDELRALDPGFRRDDGVGTVAAGDSRAPRRGCQPRVLRPDCFAPAGPAMTRGAELRALGPGFRRAHVGGTAA